jgi:hypothetical protein
MMIRWGRRLAICGFVGFTYYTYIRIYTELRNRPEPGKYAQTPQLTPGKAILFTDADGKERRLSQFPTKYSVIAWDALEQPPTLPGPFTLVTISTNRSQSEQGVRVLYRNNEELKEVFRTFQVPFRVTDTGAVETQKAFVILLNETGEVVS